MNIYLLNICKVQRFSTTILSAMMAGLDDRDDLNDLITVESMDGLSKIIALIDENNVRPILINILLRIRPCFEKVIGSIILLSYWKYMKLRVEVGNSNKNKIKRQSKNSNQIESDQTETKTMEFEIGFRTTFQFVKKKDRTSWITWEVRSGLVRSGKNSLQSRCVNWFFIMLWGCASKILYH